MSIIPVLLYILVDLLFFSNASPHGNVYEKVLQVEKYAAITCPEGFVIDGTLTRCLRVATSYEDPCEESRQCSEFLSAGATCQDGKCLCLEGYHYLHGKCHESKGLFYFCKKDSDCFVHAEYNAAACINNLCKCRDGFYQREYSTCRRKAKDVNDECFINSDCAFHKDAICKDKKCTLSQEADPVEENVYDLNKNTVSIMPTSLPILVGSDCKVDKDCVSIPNAYCGADKKCTCVSAHFASDYSNTCIPEIGEKCTVEDILHVKYTVCKDGQWTCTVDRIASKNNRICNEALRYNDKCKSTELCQLLGPRAQCVNKFCQCDSASHWIENETFCWVSKKLEEVCESNNDCVAIENSIKPVCQTKGVNTKVCSCPSESHMSDNNGNDVCIADQTELGSYCVKDNDCKVGNSTCQKNKCECAYNYFESENACLPGLGADCKDNAECKSNNTVCVQGKNEATCQCADDFVATPEKTCITKSVFNGTCNCNLQCSAVTANALCVADNSSVTEDNCGASNTGVCRCIEGDYYADGACYEKRRLGQECTKKGECFTKGDEEAFCRNGICSCDFGYKKDGDYCIPGNFGISIKMSVWMLLLVVLLFEC